MITMGGYYEIRPTGPGRQQFRLFCLLAVLLLEYADSELARRGLEGPAIAAITGLRKPWRTAFTDRDYRAVRRLGDDNKSKLSAPYCSVIPTRRDEASRESVRRDERRYRTILPLCGLA